MADNSSKMMMDQFCRNADTINKNACLAYTTNQHNLILKAMENKENISDIKCISPYVIDDDLLKIYESFDNFSKSNSKFTF